MIFLSAQPDDFYYLWQLKLQLYNFQKLGLQKEVIHVLIGFDPSKGLNPDFKHFISENPHIQFFTYPDTRINKNYSVSLRPHIISKHLELLEYLQKESIFFHDADIIFREIPSFEELDRDNTWYASDTRSYLNISYIKSTATPEIFQMMCDVVGISPESVEANDENAGGAQFIFKKSTVQFWQKIERDCESMYQLLSDYNSGIGLCESNQEKKQIQDWCAEMWVLWWNSIVFGNPMKIAEELDFCWANSPIKRWEDCKILHYTGLVKKEHTHVFRKNNYINNTPFYEDLSEISPDFCSFPLKCLIDDYVKEQNKLRTDLIDITFLLIINETNQHNIQYAIRNLTKHFKTKIIIVEITEIQSADIKILPAEYDYYFIRGEYNDSLSVIFNSDLISKISSPYISIYNPDFIAPINSILKSVSLLRKGEKSITIPSHGNGLQIDSLLATMFLKIIDPEIFTANVNKLTPLIDQTDISISFLNTRSYGNNKKDKIIRQNHSTDNSIQRDEPVYIPGDIYRLPSNSVNLINICNREA